MDDYELHRPTMRVLDIMESLASTEDGLSLTEIAAAIGASKSTIFPIIKALVKRRYIHLDDNTMRYSLGVTCWALAGSASEKNVWLRTVHEAMQDLVDACDEVCQLGILDGSDILYIAKVQSKKAVRLMSHVGKRLPAATTALGKAFFCDIDDDEIHRLHPDGLPIVTAHSIRTFEDFRRELDLTQERGYAIDAGESNEETICYAVPLKHRGKTIAALSVSVPTFRATEEKQKSVVDQLVRARTNLETIFVSSSEVSLLE